MSDPSKSPTRTRAKANSVPDSTLDPLGLIPPLGCPSSGQAAINSGPLSRGPDLLRKNLDLLPVLL